MAVSGAVINEPVHCGLCRPAWLWAEWNSCIAIRPRASFPTCYGKTDGHDYGGTWFPRFSVARHDRGGRVAYRLALDYPEKIVRLAVLDIIPTAEVWEQADKNLTLGCWSWSLLHSRNRCRRTSSRPASDAVVANALNSWGSSMDSVSSEVREAYVNVLRDRAHVHAICEEYRAAATIDHDHDRDDRGAGRRIACPVLVLWALGGPVDTWYGDAGGLIGIWNGNNGVTMYGARR